jgi:HK97 family phage portal protein
MGLRQRLAHWLDPVETRSSSWDHLAAGGIGFADASGQFVTPQSAEHSLATVNACVSVIAGAISSLPALVYRWDGERRVEAPTHPLQRLIDRGPNAHQTWADWLEFTMASVLLRGNAVSEIVTDGAGRLAGLLPIRWDVCSIVELPRGRIAYDVSEPSGGTRRLLPEEVWHLRDRSEDGIVGVSRLSRAAGVIGNAQALAEFTGAMWRNGINPSGALEAEGRIDQQQREFLKNNLRDMFAGPRNAAKILILDQSLKWRQISVSPEDAELLESRKFSVAEICRIFGTPPPLVQDYSHNTFTNSQEASRWFASNTLQPWVTKIQLEARRSLFTAATAIDHELTLDMSDLMRGSPLERWQANKLAVESGVLDPDEIRLQEGWPPRAGGDNQQEAAA